jgi:uncharacterized membrane protein (Fun14 family)
MDESSNAPNSSNKSKSIVKHVRTMPRWQKSLLTLATILLAAGLAGQAMALAKPKPQTATSSSGPPANARGIVTTEKPADQSAAPAEKAWYEKLSPHATRIGLTFLVGFIVGWAFRAFLKMMLMISVLAAAIFAGLSYFNVMNVDMSKAEQKYESSKAWLTDQAWRLKDAVQSHLPSSGASALGLFVGFRRKS